MSETMINAEGLGKRYTIGHEVENGGYTALRDVVARNIRILGRRTRDLLQGKPIIHGQIKEDVWALRDVGFSVDRGEAVGIIGRNGAGKSTLLKVLSRITEPSEGRVTLRGRVASLLEVGTGFHPELTGRENIYLNGTILGMTRAEIKRRFDAIVEFAEVEKFLDTPVKRYSSGMYVRLAFSVAAHLEPEILLVDEVLAVGDAAFQKKCLGKMGDATREGRTILFVSHNMGAITRLCQRSILLSEGTVLFDGPSDQAVKRYLAGSEPGASRRVSFTVDPDLPVAIREVSVTSPGKADSEPLDVTDTLHVNIEYVVRSDIRGTSISFELRRDGEVIFRSWDIDEDQEVFELRREGVYQTRLTMPQGLFNTGEYTLFVGVGRPGVGIIVQHHDCLSFQLEDHTRDASHKSYSRGGLLILPTKWQTEKVADGGSRRP